MTVAAAKMFVMPVIKPLAINAFGSGPLNPAVHMSVTRCLCKATKPLAKYVLRNAQAAMYL